MPYTQPPPPCLTSAAPPSSVPAPGPVLDPDEAEELQAVRRQIHGIRVSLIRAALRLGYDHDNGLVKQVLYR